MELNEFLLPSPSPIALRGVVIHRQFMQGNILHFRLKKKLNIIRVISYVNILQIVSGNVPPHYCQKLIKQFLINRTRKMYPKFTHEHYLPLQFCRRI